MTIFYKRVDPHGVGMYWEIAVKMPGWKWLTKWLESRRH